MTETRQKLIELIEPYMDKTLSEWCFIKFSIQQILWDYITIIVPIITMEEEDDNWWKYFKYLHPNNIISKGCYSIRWCPQNWIKILWHYDRTAVFKYIRSCGTDSINTEKDCFLIINNKFIENIKIPNKPLNLYTEDEEKELLDLLLKIK